MISRGQNTHRVGFKGVCETVKIVRLIFSGKNKQQGSIPGPDVICGLSLLLVLFSAPRGFSPGSPVFLSPQKPTFPNSNSIWNCQALYHAPLARVIAQALPVFDIKFDLHFSNSIIHTFDSQ